MKTFIRAFVLIIIWLQYTVTIAQTQPATESYIRFDDTRSTTWPPEVELVGIQSSADSQIQKAYFYKTRSARPQPLIISLHTWSGDYQQKDDLAPLCKQRDLNYIHPDFRGANKTMRSRLPASMPM
jgi:hypothetical protein